MPAQTIVMLNLNETRRDPRVRRVAASLADTGRRVVVVGMKGEVQTERERLENFEIVRVDVPPSYASSEMEEIERVCPEAAAILDACNPEVMGRKLGWLAWQFHRGRNFLRRRFRRAAPTPPNVPGKFDPLQEVLAIRSVILVNLAMHRAAAAEAPDVVHANDLDTLFAGFLLKRSRNIPLVFDAHEIFPEQLPPRLRSDIWHRFYTRLERLLLPHADGRMTVCDSLGKYFERTYGSGPFLTVRNCPQRSQLAPPAVLERRNSPRRITYHGAYFAYRGLEEVIRASRRVENARFVLRGIGQHERALRQLAAETGADRVEFAPPVGVCELVRSAAESDIGLCPFISVCLNTEFALPNKFFEYMAAGLAVVSADLVEMRGLIDELQLGAVYDATDADRLADALNALLADPDRLDACRHNAYAAARDRFYWEREQERLQEYYRGLLA